MANFQGKVVEGALHLRQTPGGTSLGTIPNGTNLTVSTVTGNNEWFTTTYNNQFGYVMARFIAITTGGTAATVTTAGGVLNIRATPSSGGTVSFTLTNGTNVRVLDTTPTNGFYRIGSSSGTGWASTAYITLGGGGGVPGTGQYIEYFSSKTTASVHCRESTSTDAVIWYTFPSGATLDAREIRSTQFPDATWIMTKTPGGTWGYSLRQYIDVSYSTNQNYADVFYTSNLSNGSSGRFVSNLQHYLNRYLGNINYAKISVNGTFGSSTEQAVRAFQTFRGISSDGVVGNTTKQHLVDYVNGR